MLASVLFDYDAHTDTYVEREYTDDEIEACDVTSWQDTCVPAEDGSIMLYERWFQSNAFTLATIRNLGDDMRESSSKVIADTDRPSTWGELDRAYGSRAEWESDLATVGRMIRAS